MQSRDESSHLREQTKLLWLEFLKMELVTCSTFARVAETEYKIRDEEHGDRALAEAEKAYTTLLRFLSDRKDMAYIGEDDQEHLATHVKELRAKLDGIHHWRSSLKGVGCSIWSRQRAPKRSPSRSAHRAR